MGIIRKQTLSGSIYSYAGVLVGFINLAVLSPIVFSTEQIGLPALIISISVIASQLGSLGFNNVTIRLFPYFREKESSHNGFLGLNFMVQSIGLILVIIGMLFFIPVIIERNSEDISMLGEFAYLCIPIIVFQLYFVLFDGFCRVIFNATLGIFLKEFLVRVLNLLLILLYWYDLVDFTAYMYLYVFAYGTPAIVIILYLLIKKELKLKPDFNFLNLSLLKEIKSVSFYGIIAGLSGIAVISIDRYLINDFFNLASVGVYSIAFYFGTLLLIPGRSMTKIAAPVIADSWKQDDLDNIKDIYRKSSINQFLAALGIFVLLWLNVDDLFLILPEEYASGRLVIFYIALANIFTVLSGVSVSILGTSGKYKYSTYFMLILIILIIISNVLLIPRWGIIGAAFATCLSTFIYVLIRMLFLYFSYGMNPFSRSHIKILIAVLISYYTVYYIPLSFAPLINIIIRLAIAGSIYSLLVYFLRCSDDLNQLTDKVFQRIFRKTS